MNPLSGSVLRKLQQKLREKKIIIIDEVSMMGKKMLHQIGLRLRQASGKQDELSGGYWIIFVGDFQQLLPVGDKPIYENDGSPASARYALIENVVMLTRSQRQGNDPDFWNLLVRCSTGQLTQEDWNILKTRFTPYAPDSNDLRWDDAPHLFYDNKSAFEYNMTKLNALGNPIAHNNADHSNRAAARRDSAEANGLQSVLYSAVNAEVMLTSNLWAEVGLHKGAKGKVVDFVYRDREGPRGCKQPVAVVVQFNVLDEELGIMPFLDDVPHSVAIPLVQAEWQASGKTFTRKQFPLALSSAFTTHKSQGKTLDKAVIDLGKSEKCSGMSLVALSRVRHLSDLLLEPFSFERLTKVNQSNSLPMIQAALQTLQQKFNATRELLQMHQQQ